MPEKASMLKHANTFLAQKVDGILQDKESSGPLPLKRIQSLRQTKQTSKIKASKPKNRASKGSNND